MENIKIEVVENATRFIYPFQYYLKNDLDESKKINPFKIDKNDNLFFQVNKIFNNDIKWNKTEDTEKNYILPFVNDFFDGDEKDVFVTKYTMDKQKALLGSAKFFHLVRERKEDFVNNIKINDIFLYNFRSEIGMLILDISLLRVSEKTVDYFFNEKNKLKFNMKVDFGEIIRFNNNFQNFNKQNGIILPRKAVNKNEVGEFEELNKLLRENVKDKYMVLSINELIQELLFPLKNNNIIFSPFEDKHLFGYNFLLANVFSNDYDVVFNEVKEKFYHLRTFTNDLYLPSKNDVEIENNAQIYRPFQNIFWGASMFGNSSLVFKNKSEFINFQFKSRVFGEYFKIFLIVLHQNLLLNKTAQIFSYFTTKQMNHEKLKNLVKEINSIRDKFLAIITRCWFPAISNNNIYNRVYVLWRNTFNVEMMYQDIHRKITELDEYLERHYQKISHERSKIIEIIAFIFLPLTFITGFWGMNFIEISGAGISFQSSLSLTINLVMLILFILLLTVLLLLRRK